MTTTTDYERGTLDETVSCRCQHCGRLISRGTTVYIARRYNPAGAELVPHVLHTACYDKLSAESHRAEAARQAAQHVPAGMTLLRSRYAGTCSASGRPIRIGDAIYWSRETGAVLVDEYREGVVGSAPCTDIPDDDHGEGLISTSVGGSESDSACGSY